jgi:hypothetical protein
MVAANVDVAAGRLVIAEEVENKVLAGLRVGDMAKRSD